jgi:hypothetical protein
MQQARPEFQNPAWWQNPDGANFQLTACSPAIDMADSGAVGEQPTDILGNPRVDDPFAPNTGTGPRTYDDDGPHEYQRNQASAPSACRRPCTRPCGTARSGVAAPRSPSGSYCTTAARSRGIATQP